MQSINRAIKRGQLRVQEDRAINGQSMVNVWKPYKKGKKNVRRFSNETAKLMYQMPMR